MVTGLIIVIILFFILVLAAVILLTVACIKKKKGQKAKAYFISFGMIAGIILVLLLAYKFFLGRFANYIIDKDQADSSISVIGGSDGPTSVFIAGKFREDEDDKKLKLKVQKKKDVNWGISTLPLDIMLEAVEYKDGYLMCNITNQSGYTYTFGEEYALEKKDNEEWVRLEPIEDFGWHDIEIVVEDLEERLLTYDLSIFGNLEVGEYRLIIDNDLCAEFTLVE